MQMNFLTFEITEGERIGSKLLWVPEEKHLYYNKDTRKNGRIVYLCYENRLDKSNSCSARCFVDPSGKLTTNATPHSNHKNHKAKFEDLKSTSAIKNTTIQVAHVLRDLHVTVPTQHIFTREMARSVRKKCGPSVIHMRILCCLCRLYLFQIIKISEIRTYLK